VTEPALDLFDDESLAEPVAEALRRLVIAGFHALWGGRTLTVAEFEAGDPTAVTAAVDHLRARGRIEISVDGRVIAVHGLARRATPHRIEHNDGVVNTWCALDAVGIPAAMGIDARAVTQCPTCGQRLTVTLSRGEPQPLPGAVLRYPQVRCAHLVDDFCSGANLFCSVDHLERWLDDNPAAGRVMTIGEAAELGRETWREAGPWP
jgi:alkylmercury lyase